jgi:hypothetical protein
MNRRGLWDMKEGEGHAWVIDGYTSTTYKTTYECRHYYQGQHNYTHEAPTQTVTESPLLHHNWGWSGQYDCWLNIGVFAPYPNDPNFEFEYNVEIITNIRPK